MGATVVGRGDGPEPFLAGGIPLKVTPFLATDAQLICPEDRSTYDLKFHGLSIELDSSDFLGGGQNQHDVSPLSTKSYHPTEGEERVTHEINADSRNVAFGVGIVRKSKQQARLSDTGVADEEKLEEVIVSVRGSGLRPIPADSWMTSSECDRGKVLFNQGNSGCWRHG
jgi:hypothetical protein